MNMDVIKEYERLSKKLEAGLITVKEFNDRTEQFHHMEPERPKGHWINVKGSNGKDYHKCSCCLHTADITGVKNYCNVCGAEMMGEE